MELMEGLTVLSTGTQNGIGGKIVLGVLGFIVAVLAVACVALAVISFADGKPGAGVWIMVLAAWCVFTSVVAFIAASEETKTTYKVTIDENVSFVEFSERYEIIDQDGLIYEIVEKGE